MAFAIPGDLLNQILMTAERQKDITNSRKARPGTTGTHPPTLRLLWLKLHCKTTASRRNTRALAVSVGRTAGKIIQLYLLRNLNASMRADKPRCVLTSATRLTGLQTKQLQ